LWGRVGEGGYRALGHISPDILDHIVGRFQDILVPVAQHPKSVSFEPSSACSLVVTVEIVLAAVDLDDEAR
jgi:hypothetical protein